MKCSYCGKENILKKWEESTFNSDSLRREYRFKSNSLIKEAKRKGFRFHVKCPECEYYVSIDEIKRYHKRLLESNQNFKKIYRGF